MRCRLAATCASHAGATLPATAPPDTVEAEAVAAFEAILMEAAFAPVAKAMGFYGDVVVGAALRAAFVERAR